MRPVEPASVPRRPGHLAWQEVAGEAVVLDSRARVLRGLNATGARVWDLVDGSRTVADIATVLAAEWNRDAGDALADVTRFVEALRERGLVEI
jgi:pyrroloquinoline quinone biosynthesis protein D